MELNGRVKEQAQRAETAEAGIREWQDTLAETRATPEQFGQSMGYLRAINSGDPAQMSQGFDMLLREVQDLAKILGKPVPGMVDPLDAHPDLKEQVEMGDLPRKVAEELAGTRAHQAIATASQQHQQSQAQAQQAQERGLAELSALGAQLRTKDPDFARKLEALAPTIDLIQRTVPPAQWAAETQAAYNRLPAMPAPVAAPAPIRNQPIRPSGQGGRSVPTFSPDTTDAFKFGVEQAMRGT